MLAPPTPGCIALLLATARVILSDADRACIRDAAAAVTDWSEIVTHALAHGTAGLLCHHLRHAAPALLPPDIAQAADAFLAQGNTAHARAVRELGEVLDTLAAAGVAALPYKGPVLAATCYDPPGLRGCRDLDLLLAERDAAAAMAALASLGYASLVTGLRPGHMRAYFRYNGQDALVAEGRLAVEPHWRFAPACLHAEPDHAGLLARAMPITLGGRAIPAPSPEDAALICGLHGSKEEWARLIWVVDMAELLRLPGLDWATCLDRAASVGVQRMVLVGAALASRLLAAPLPGPVASALAADPTGGTLAAEAAENLFARAGVTPSVYTITRFRLRMRERLADRARYALGTLFTARVQHFRAVDLPEWLRFLYPLVRLGHDFIALPLWRLLHPPRPSA